MSRIRTRLTLLALAAAAGLGACRPPEQLPSPVAIGDIPVYEIASGADTAGLVIQPARSRDPLAGVSDRRVTLASSNADVRTLLLWLAQEGGISLVISPDVRARVSVNFRDVLVADAVRALMAEARLSFLVTDAMSPWPPVVFYQIPVNINEAPAEVIAARFGVSLELANWIVESRPKP